MRTPIIIKKAAMNKEAVPFGILNSIRAGELSPEQSYQLREYYGLKPKAGLKTRAFWRGWAHSQLGSIGGGLMGSAFGPIGSGLGAVAGGVAAGLHSGSKYSLSGYKKVLSNIDLERAGAKKLQGVK